LLYIPELAYSEFLKVKAREVFVSIDDFEPEYMEFDVSGKVAIAFDVKRKKLCFVEFAFFKVYSLECFYIEDIVSVDVSVIGEGHKLKEKKVDLLVTVKSNKNPVRKICLFKKSPFSTKEDYEKAIDKGRFWKGLFQVALSR